jgi:hypothetical protein
VWPKTLFIRDSAHFSFYEKGAPLIASMTVSTQAIKAALANPVEALRYE